jgi:hypothetical protein
MFITYVRTLLTHLGQIWLKIYISDLCASVSSYGTKAERINNRGNSQDIMSTFVRVGLSASQWHSISQLDRLYLCDWADKKFSL